MEIFTNDGILLLGRWVHILAGITWIGLLYYFNFVQTPFFAEIEPDVRTTAVRKLVPRALLWFRYAALLTFLAGVFIIILRLAWTGTILLGSSYWVSILTGMVLGTLMFLNVWLVIWPNQKIVIASAERVASGGEADPRAADAGRRGLLMSRTNVVFSIPMVFFMATASHLVLFGPETSSVGKWAYGVVAAVVIAAVQLNAMSGLTGTTKRPLEKIESTILWGGILWAVLYFFLQLFTRGG
ncbi:MAG: urate hydroxylase PuuD [Actinomycetota bacterium]